MDSYKEQVHQLEYGNREILREKQRLDEELRNMADNCAYLETDRDRNMEQVQLLEEHIKEMELVGGGTTLDKVVSHRASVVIEDGLLEEEVGNTMEENMKKANVTELRLTIGRLQRQIKEMEVKAPADAQEEEAEAMKTHKEQLQKDYENVLTERNRLRDELSQIRNGIPDSLLNQTQTIMAFRSRILDLEKESTNLKESTVQLEKIVSEGTHTISKDSACLLNFEKEHAKIQDRINRLEDITKMQLHDINRMLVEANYLNGVNNNRDEDESFTDRPGLSEYVIIYIRFYVY